MDKEDLRDPGAEARQRKLTVIAVAAVTALGVATAGYAALAARPADHHYLFAMEYTNDIAGPFTLMVPLPADGEFRANWTYLGSAAASLEDTSFGKVLRLSGTGNVSAASYFDTWRDVPITLSTEGSDSTGRLAAWVYFNNSNAAGRPHMNLTVREVDPVWTTEHFVNGDLVEGWSAIAIREEIAHAH